MSLNIESNCHPDTVMWSHYQSEFAGLVTYRARQQDPQVTDGFAQPGVYFHGYPESRHTVGVNYGLEGDIVSPTLEIKTGKGDYASGAVLYGFVDGSTAMFQAVKVENAGLCIVTSLRPCHMDHVLSLASGSKPTTSIEDVALLEPTQLEQVQQAELSTQRQLSLVTAVATTLIRMPESSPNTGNIVPQQRGELVSSQLVGRQ